MNETAIQPQNLRSWPVQANVNTGQTTKSSSSSSFNDEFRQILATLVLGMSLPSITTGESSGFSMGNLMAPLMLTLLEKLLAQDVVTEQQETTPTPVTIEATQTEEDEGIPVDSPQGKPIDGYITQRAHAGHIALDFGAPEGTPVYATMDGEVIYAGWNNEGYGNLVIVENGPYKTYFAHLSSIPVKVGDRVKAKTVIGLSGNTGNSTGPHLHYEVRKNNQQIDPASFTL